MPRLSQVAELRLTGPSLRPTGIRFGLDDPDQTVLRYAQPTHQALRAVFGETAVESPAREPHIALAYGTGGDITGLPEALAARPLWHGAKLGPVRLIITDTDTFADREPARHNTVDIEHCNYG